MNFKISKKDFLDALNISNKAISSSTPLPILSGVKIVCEANTLYLFSSDSNISIKNVIKDNIEINEDGKLVVDIKYLLEIIRKVDSETIYFETIDGTLIKISGGTSEYKINGISAEDYPNISFELPKNIININAEKLTEMVQNTIFACSQKETRPVLTGVNIKTKDNKLIVNATDSYRVAYQSIDYQEEKDFNITVPAKYLIEVIRSVGNDKEIKIALDNQQIFFILSNAIIKTRLLDDAFPEVEKLIPTKYTQTLKVDSRELLNQLDRTSFIKGEGKSVVKFNISKECVDITSKDAIGSFFGKMSVVSFEGEPFKISCSNQYLIDAVKTISSDVVTICFSGELKPMVLKDANDDNLIQLISPVRTYD